MAAFAERRVVGPSPLAWYPEDIWALPPMRASLRAAGATLTSPLVLPSLLKPLPNLSWKVGSLRHLAMVESVPRSLPTFLACSSTPVCHLTWAMM